MSKLVTMTLVLLAMSAPAFAQDPCAAPLATAVNPTDVFIGLPEFTKTLPDGSPYVASVELGVILNGAAAPTSLLSLPRAAFSLVAGTTACYTAPLAQPLAVPVGDQHVIAARAINKLLTGVWASGSPFVVVGAPFVSSVRVR